MEQPDKENIENLLPRYCEGKVTEEERQEVETWMEMSEENRRIAKQIHVLYLATDTINVMKKVDTEEALSKVTNRMTDKRKTTWWEWTQRVAAVLFIPLLSVWLIQTLSKDDDIQMMEAKTNPGMTTSLTLSDGTVVFLNSGSSLIYPSRFKGDKREVTLKGEAYFEVAKNPEKRFIVSTSHDSQVEVLGTRFNVEAYEKDKDVLTTLVEGKVGFLFKQGEQTKEVKMKPGQKLVYDSETGEVQLYATSGESELAWKDGKIVFMNTPLTEALRILGKRYNVEFILKNKVLKDDSFTGTFTNQRLERVLEYFQISSRIRWRYIETPDIKTEKSKIEIY